MNTLTGFADQGCSSQIDNPFSKYKLKKCMFSYMSSWKSSIEGDFARNHSVTLILSVNIQIPAEILKMMRYSLLRKTFICISRPEIDGEEELLDFPFHHYAGGRWR